MSSSLTRAFLPAVLSGAVLAAGCSTTSYETAMLPRNPVKADASLSEPVYVDSCDRIGGARHIANDGVTFNEVAVAAQNGQPKTYYKGFYIENRSAGSTPGIVAGLATGAAVALLTGNLPNGVRIALIGAGAIGAGSYANQTSHLASHIELKACRNLIDKVLEAHPAKFPIVPAYNVPVYQQFQQGGCRSLGHPFLDHTRGRRCGPYGAAEQIEGLDAVAVVAPAMALTRG